jgi:ATP phosphoribosyltransferase
LFQIFDTGLDPVKIVCAAPASVLVNGELPRDRRIVVASEYENLSRRWLRDQKVPHIFRRTFGATEVFPPEDADCIIDNTATGTTLKVSDRSFFFFDLLLDLPIFFSPHLFITGQ